MPELTVTCTLSTYPDNPDTRSEVVRIWSHVLRGRIVLQIDGKEYVLIGTQLKQAIDNALNAH